LPVDEYRALKRAAYPADPEPSPPPVDATLSRIDYDLKVDGDLASGEARLTVDVIKQGWVKLPIPAGLMVREARLNGQEVSLVTGSSPAAETFLLLSRPGRSVLALQIVAPITTVAGTEMVKLPVSSSAISRASLQLSRQGVDVRVTGGMLLEHTETPSGARLVANGHGSDPLTFAWKRKIEDLRANQPLRFRGSLTELVGLGEDTTQLTAEVQIEVVQ